MSQLSVLRQEYNDNRQSRLACIHARTPRERKRDFGINTTNFWAAFAPNEKFSFQIANVFRFQTVMYLRQMFPIRYDSYLPVIIICQNN